jgi:hypothetical protein
VANDFCEENKEKYRALLRGKLVAWSEDLESSRALFIEDEF